MTFSNQDLRRLIVPLVIEQFLAVTIGISDTIMVSSAGEAAVSGVALVDSINILLINIFSALGTGGAIVASQYLGRRDRDNACLAARQLVIVVAAISTLIGIGCAAGDRNILQLVFGSVDGGVMRNAEVYFFFSALSYPFLALYNAGAALFRAMGNSKVSMYTGLMMNILNIGGNAFMVYVMHMGAAGVAIASMVARIIGCFVMLNLLRHPENAVYIESYLHLGFSPSTIRSILKIGIPNGTENGMFQLGKILVQGLVASFGTIAIAANAVANSVASFDCIPGTAFGLAMITVVGQCVGAGNYDEARYYMKKLLKMAYLCTLVLNLAIVLLLPLIMRAYSLTPETTTMAEEILYWHALFMITLWPAAFTLPNGLRAASDVRFTMTVSVVSMWICRIAMSFVFGKMLGMGVLGIWFAMFLDWVVRAAFFVVRVRGTRWQEKKLLA